jgi:hypothetical protein
LFDSGERDCNATVGPSQPTYEECSSNSTTAPLTTTSPMQPGNFFYNFNKISDELSELEVVKVVRVRTMEVKKIFAGQY